MIGVYCSDEYKVDSRRLNHHGQLFNFREYWMAARGRKVEPTSGNPYPITPEICNGIEDLAEDTLMICLARRLESGPIQIFDYRFKLLYRLWFRFLNWLRGGKFRGHSTIIKAHALVQQEGMKYWKPIDLKKKDITDDHSNR